MTSPGPDATGSNPEEDPADGPSTGREHPVGKPVVRGDSDVAGKRARGAVEFDPEDPDSLERAARTVTEFAADEGHGEEADNVYVLRGAAAAAALARGEGSYRAAARRAGENVSVPFLRKWARVHDLPRSIRQAVAAGTLAPSAAMQIARLGSEDRLSLAWATIDDDLTVREVRSVASAVDDGTPIERALAEVGVDLGEVTVELPPPLYHELRRRTAEEGVDPDRIVARALERELSDE